MFDLKSLCIFGDSIMKGVMLDNSSKKYVLMPGRDFSTFTESYGMTIDNNSKFGCTIDRGMERIDKTLSQGHKYDAALLEYGGNDCDFNWREVSEAPECEHQPKTQPETFRRLYKEMITKLQSAGILPLVMTLPPIDAEKYLTWLVRGGLSRENIIKWLGDVNMIYRFQEFYSTIAADVARECGAVLVDVRSAFLTRHDFDTLICDDGIHPNEKGHFIISETFKSAASAYGA